MSHEVDCRSSNWNPLSARRESELRAYASEASSQLPSGHTIHTSTFNLRTGNPSVITSEAAPASYYATLTLSGDDNRLSG